MRTLAELQRTRWWHRSLCCSHCGIRLNRHLPLVIATRNCPQCGLRVVDEAEGRKKPPFAREQVDAACAANRRTRWRATANLVIALLLTYAVLLTPAVLEPEAVQSGAPVGNLVLFLLLLLPSLVAWRGVVLFRRARQDALKCPDCRKPCSASPTRFANLTQLTGYCRSCGAMLTSDLTDEPHMPLSTVADYAPAASRQFWKTTCEIVMFITILGGLAVALILLTYRIFLTSWFMETYGLVGVYLFGTGFAALLAFESVGVYLLYRRRKRRARSNPALGCPHCHSELAPMSRVIASRRCPRCCRRVLADPDAVANHPRKD